MAEENGKVWRYPIERQHDVSNPIIFSSDIDLQRRMFYEAAVSTGVMVDFYRCMSDVRDFNNDPNCMWEDCISLPVIFDDAPKVKVLKELGWFSEDDERPMLVYLPMYKNWSTKELLDVRENSLMRVHFFDQPIPAEFRVMDKKMDSIYGVHWVCKLAPERLDQFYLVNDSGRHFLKKQKRYFDEADNTVMTEEDRRVEHSEFMDTHILDDTRDDYYDMIMGSDSENNNVFFRDKGSIDKVKEKEG